MGVKLELIKCLKYQLITDQSADVSIETIFVTYSCGSRILDDFGGVHLLKEDLVELNDEVTVVDETWLVLTAISVDQLKSLGLGQIHSKSANAGAEL